MFMCILLNMNNKVAFIFDLFFIISAHIGIGFVTGKEIEQFFLSGSNIFVTILSFFCIFVLTCSFILFVKNKYNISNIHSLNQLAFGKYHTLFNIVLITQFLISCSAMLAGCDNIMLNIFNITIPIFSLCLSVITFFILCGGVGRIKLVSNFLLPILMIGIITNITYNYSPPTIAANINYKDILFPILFCCENSLTLIAVLLKTKSKPRPLVMTSGIIISLVILFSLFVIVNFSADMPLLLASKNLGVAFFIIYIIIIIFALFITLQICAYNSLEIALKWTDKKYISILIILLVAQSLSRLGFTFIIKYLYTMLAVVSGVYLLILFIKFSKDFLKYNKLNNKNCEINTQK